MRVGVPKEIKTEEYRLGLTPASVRELVAHGHQVLVQTGGGLGIGIGDERYRAVGATIVDSAEEIFATAELIVKSQGAASAGARPTAGRSGAVHLSASCP